MSSRKADTWKTYAQAFAFAGNTLLKPMTQTSAVGLEAAFWRAFPDFGSSSVRLAADECAAFAESLAELDSERAIEQVSVEYTRLFVGPPKPAAPPWETMYRSDNVTVGFGDPTFEMRRLLREAGLQLSNENNQYEDHMGIELLYISVQCERLSCGLATGQEEMTNELAARIRLFAAEHPASWIDLLIERVGEAFPEGYFVHVLRLGREMLKVIAEQA